MKLYERFVDGLKDYFFSEQSFDLRKYSKSIEKTFESFLDEFPDFSLRIDKRKIVLLNKNYGVANA